MSQTALATRADLGPIAAMLSRAFADDPVQQWLFTNATDYPGALDDFMGFFAERYFALGHVYVAPGAVGATLWAPPDRHALNDEHLAPLFACVGQHIGDRAEPGLTELGKTIDYLPAEPHVYLGIAGVDPASQGSGLGAALMEPGLRMADEGRFAVHLESSNPRNLAFYRRHGFAEIGEFRCGDEDGPVMTPMRREPR